MKKVIKKLKNRKKNKPETNEILEAFNDIKNNVQYVTKENLSKEIAVLKSSLDKAKEIGQTALVTEIEQLISVKKKELLLPLGDLKVVSLSELKKLRKIGGNNLLFDELAKYPREIPEENAEIIKKVGSHFDVLFVLYTDYVDEHIESKVKEKDPIVFGAFKKDEKNEKYKDNVADRLYFITD